MWEFGDPDGALRTDPEPLTRNALDKLRSLRQASDAARNRYHEPLAEMISGSRPATGPQETTPRRTAAGHATGAAVFDKLLAVRRRRLRQRRNATLNRTAPKIKWVIPRLGRGPPHGSVSEATESNRPRNDVHA